MNRLALAAFAGLSLSNAAFAQEAKADACVLTATETNVGPKRPHLITLSLDCGTKATADQQTHVATVSNKTTFVDAVQYLFGAGYDLRGLTTMLSYSGNAITHTAVFARAPAAPVLPAPPDDLLDDMDLPEEAGDDLPTP